MGRSAAELKTALADVGAVVIGRNEGVLLRQSLGSLLGRVGTVVYADSASTDGSVELVRREFPQVVIVELDPSRRMSASRGRNEGYAELKRHSPNLRYVQFLDGDCELAEGWLHAAVAFLDANPGVGVLAGALRERDRERNVYHRLADMEWDQPPGEVTDMGGIMVVRSRVWDEVGGQNPDIPAAEEREFCWRVLDAGHKLIRLGDKMCTHDIDMSNFGEWWTRSVRNGHAFAQGYWVHRDRWHLKQVLSMVGYGAALPSAAVAGALPTLGLSLGLLGAYPRLWRKVERDRRRRGDRADDARLYATATVVGKVAAAIGVASFFRRALLNGSGGSGRV